MKILSSLIAVAAVALTVTSARAAPAVKSGHIEAGGINYYYEIQGEGAGTPLLLLHGGLGSTGMFQPIMPRLIEGVRLSLGPAFLFLISAEAIAADTGLGYRIFLVRRYLSMDVILPYVAWITLLAYLMDFALSLLSRRVFSWAHIAERR